MAISLKKVIEAARDANPLFYEAKHPDPVCVRFLSLYEKELAGEAQRVRRDLIASETSVELPLATFDDGFTLPANDYVHGATAVLTDGKKLPCELVPWENRFHAGVFPAITEHGAKFYLTGVAADWTLVDKLLVSYWPAHTDFIGLASVPLLPDSAFGVYVAQLVWFLARRCAAMKPEEKVDVPGYKAEADLAQARWLEKIQQRDRATVTFVREVW